MSKLKVYKFSDLYKMSSGISSKPEQAGHGSQFVSFKTVFNNYFLPEVLTEFMDISEKEKEIYSIKKGDILLTRTSETLDELGMSCVAVKDYPSSSYSGFLKRLRPNQNGVTYDKYLAFYLRSDLFRKTMTNNSIMTLRASLNEQIFSYLELILPDFNEQKKAGDLLYSLNQKIELNNKINAELEAMAKTLYDYWFVQFDFPFDFAQDKPDANGKPYKSSGGKMVYNEELKREIPEGWEVKSLLDVANFTNGLACQKFRPKENEDFYRVIKIREMGSGFTDNSEFVSTTIPERVVINNGDILFSWSATLDVKIWTGGKGALNQHIFKVTSNKYPNSYYYYELLNYLQHFKMQAELRKTTMGHITQDHLKQSRITIPPIDLIKKLDSIIHPILEKKVKLEEENQQLASLRDWLLPMLMNGQVRVGEVDEELDMVAEPRESYGNKS
ncbi:restriction endonuclease subunit S [Flavobacterium sp. 7A]|uniref:restriction endonuclease subunit S n=1 Tax=Flavobacterium sp. 7A TaxID=2940571 RepID=UPI0022260995|nr:restriction endonuclease subunit S [Flavobacterium sp. 7A]MCW2121205.1 type I restriction enzyme S subunit [Flavobacterium sp. 7A]